MLAQCEENIKYVYNKQISINQRLNLDAQDYAFITCCTVAKEDKERAYQGFDLDLES